MASIVIIAGLFPQQKRGFPARAMGCYRLNRPFQGCCYHLNQLVKTILEKYADARLPLTRFSPDRNEDDARKLQAIPALELFPGAREPEAALSGLLLLLNCWERSHAVSQEIHSGEGSYWHGIAHRMEPDSANAGYWFRRTGKHPIFRELHAQAQQILEEAGKSSTKVPWRLKLAWDPFLFVDWCDEARTKPGSAQEQIALAIQEAEWRLLFNWCAAPGI